MFRVQNQFRAVAGAVIFTICETMAAPLFGQQQPTAQLVEVIEYYDRATESWGLKNLAVAGDACQEGLRRLRRVPDNNESRRVRGRFEPLCADVRDANKRLDQKVRAVQNITGNGRLNSATSALAEIEEYSDDFRYQDAKARLTARKEEFKGVLSEAEDHEQAGQKKAAHNAYKRADSLNKEAGLKPKIKDTNGCYAACKTAIWTVALAAAGAGSYFGYKEYEKRKH